MRRWCSRIVWGERGTTLTYGWAIDSRGALAGVHGPTEYLVQPEDGSAPQWVRAGHIDFDPIRTEGGAQTMTMPTTPAAYKRFVTDDDRIDRVYVVKLGRPYPDDQPWLTTLYVPETRSQVLSCEFAPQPALMDDGIPDVLPMRTVSPDADAPRPLTP